MRRRARKKTLKFFKAMVRWVRMGRKAGYLFVFYFGGCLMVNPERGTPIQSRERERERDRAEQSRRGVGSWYSGQTEQVIALRT